MTAANLFEQVKLGPYNLPNRIVMAPLTRNRAGEGNVPQTLNRDYYAQRASAGLIITEATQISAQGIGYPATPGIYTSAQIEGWREVTKAVHKNNGHIFLQLWHVGRISHPSLQPNGKTPVAPSAIKPSGEAITDAGPKPFVLPRELRLEEIKNIINDYVQAAKNAIKAGFDGVEIHAANGYLIDQFIRDSTNKRKDKYGGTLDNRARFLKEIVEAVCMEVGADKVGVRISPENTVNDIYDSEAETTFCYLVEMLATYNFAYLHVVEGDFVSATRNFKYRELKNRFPGLYIANAGYNLSRAQLSLVKGDADLISFGSLYIANPDLVSRFAKNAPLNAPDKSTYYGGDHKGYTDYPTL